MEIGENMGALEIILLAAGIVIFIASFCIPVKQEKLKEEAKNLAAQEIKDMVGQEIDHVHERLEELSAEEMQRRIEESERSMERISNEKIMAVGEYSDTVLEEIHKSHEEVVFLYDMLKNKREGLEESYAKADKEIQDLLQQVKDSEITVQETLKELEKKLGEFAAEEAKKASYVETGQEEKEVMLTGIEALSRKSAEKKSPGKGSAKAENTPFTEAGIAGEEKEAVGFLPFTPEKIEVVPKRKTAGKTAKKSEGTEEKGDSGEVTGKKATGRKSSAKKTTRVNEMFLPENEELMLLSPDSVKNVENKKINSNGRILELHRAGKSNMAIARELGLGIGEVKLVIDLYEGLR